MALCGLNADGTFTYESEAGFVGTDSLSSQLPTVSDFTSLAMITVDGTVDDADRRKAQSIAASVLSRATSTRMFYPNNPPISMPAVRRS